MKFQHRLAVVLCFCVLLGLLPASAGSQTVSSQDQLTQGIILFEGAQFPEALKALEQALAAGDLSDRGKANANFYLGQVYVIYENKAKATQYFSAAKGALPNYQPPPNLSPVVMELWEKAPKPSVSAKTARPGGMMWRHENDFMVDQDKRQGVKVGSQFGVIKTTRIPRPGGGEIVRERRIAVLQVTEVLDGGSMAKLVRGDKQQLINELQARPQDKQFLPVQRLKESKTKTEAPPKGTPAPAAASTNRMVVLPPGIKDPDVNYGPLDWPNGYTPEKVAQAVKTVPDVPGEIVGVSQEKMDELKLSYAPFTITDFLKETGSNQSIGSAIMGGGLGALWRPPLTKAQTGVLAKILDKLGARYALIWGFYFASPDQYGKVLVCLFEKNKKKPLLTGSANVNYEDVMLQYPKEVEDIVDLYYNPPDDDSQK
ncbi:MAG: tetratricopeptide repeat protein [Desulfarculaceae bacterium]|nr:tetratricopeptide repeat protein [Desulfarculaceae bacterium]MCF8072141.1 tetratricopeptide repeat protein [Desulfarculaceae bacterium]MCF8100062.1 tetratricopeptide repeat protein [Desulfarculaceae bacterium]MCF8118269.1 tetratricopeptide repeat protein [Desulfarculaceae bacterium]